MDIKKIMNSKNLRPTLIAVCIVLGLIFAALLGSTVYAEYLLGKVNYVDPNATMPTLSQEEIDAIHNAETESMDPDFTGPVLNEEDLILETAPKVEVNNENVVNFLLIGADYQSGDMARSDSMILCTFNKNTSTQSRTTFFILNSYRIIKLYFSCIINIYISYRTTLYG